MRWEKVISESQEKEIEALKAENAHYKKTMKSILERLELLEDKK